MAGEEVPLVGSQSVSAPSTMEITL
jgi:hypothetical protein